jgi:hypothetical protein
VLGMQFAIGDLGKIHYYYFFGLKVVYTSPRFEPSQQKYAYKV